MGGREDISREPDAVTTIDKDSAFDAECLQKKMNKICCSHCTQGFGGYMPLFLVFTVVVFDIRYR